MNKKAETLGKNIGKIIVSRVQDQLHKFNKNYMHVFCGDPGSGKSYCSLAFACAVDPEFDPENIVFDVRSFIKLIRMAKKGTSIVFDEAEVEGSSRDWQSARNKALKAISETFRFRNLAVYWTAPTFGDIDRGVRLVLHAFSESIGIDYDNKIALMTYEQILKNRKTGDIYFKPVKIHLKNGAREIRWLGFTLPPKKILNEYEKMKQEFFEDLLDKLDRELEELAEGNGRKRKDSDDAVYRMAETVVENRNRYVFRRKTGQLDIDIGKIIADFKVGRSTAYAIRRTALAMLEE
jgi:hypothetical protein